MERVFANWRISFYFHFEREINVVERKEVSVFLKCDCGCCMLVIDKEEWKDGETTYNISIADSRYDHNHNTILGRIKNAIKVLFGKSVYYNDIYIGDSTKFKSFLEELNKLVQE
jgi:hypothetical protein